ncbi:MAG TPA: formate dehydrogenase accessory sulfurtransferase FdhD [Burkholderiales bacterium]|nr:formate dehydrogenase accessory sulfurtransferase FdhD [Burkholderiales bacterium]
MAAEVPVALVYNGVSHAVMLATPRDIEDFALGFSLSEGILRDPGELYSIEVERLEAGIEAQLSIAAERMMELKARRRSLAGRTGCGLCGAESLAHAARTPGRILPGGGAASASAIHRAMDELAAEQVLHRETGATHAAGWADWEGRLLLAREDVGRHNALDKLIGAMAQRQLSSADGFAVITSRASSEMVQKAASFGIPLLAAMSAPTDLAVRLAADCGLTLIGFVRGSSHTVYAGTTAA